MLNHILDEDGVSCYMLCFLFLQNTCGGYDDIHLTDWLIFLTCHQCVG